MKLKLFLAAVLVLGVSVTDANACGGRLKGRLKAVASRVLGLAHKVVHRHHDHSGAHRGSCATCK